MENKKTNKEITLLGQAQMNRVIGGTNNQYGCFFCPYCGTDLRKIMSDSPDDHIKICKCLTENATYDE